MSNMTLGEGRQRFSAISAALADSGEAAIRVGFAEFERHETVTELIARADSQLIHSRRA